VVCLELKRNSDQRNGVYRAELAHKKARIRQLKRLKNILSNHEVQNRAEKYLLMDHSPEQIVGISKKEGLECVSIERIYQFIWNDKRNGRRLHQHLR